MSAFRVDVFAVKVGVTEAGEPVDGSLLDDGFRKVINHFSLVIFWINYFARIFRIFLQSAGLR